MNVSDATGWSSLFLWAYAGVDHSFDGNGGDDCRDFIPTNQKIIESIIFFSIGVLELCYAWPRISVPAVVRGEGGGQAGRRIMLAVMCVVFGIELGFKLASRQMIWVLNPCHLVTMTQIFLLAAPPCKLATALFRIQMHVLNGATIAILLPIINTRLLPFEVEVYYIQHALILFVPFYLLSMGGVYVAESYTNFTWVLLTLGLLFVYHWLPLELLAIASRVNLNNMLCPAVSDPFHGRWYRAAAATHQTALIFVHGKFYTFLSSLILGRRVTEGAAVAVGWNGAAGNAAVRDSEGKLANGYTKSD